MAKKSIPIQICGTVYNVDSDSDIDPLELLQIAKYVEEQIKEASDNPNIEVSTSKIAILACMNIACELFRLKASHENLSLTVNTKADELVRLIDSALK